MDEDGRRPVTRRPAEEGGDAIDHHGPGLAARGNLGLKDFQCTSADTKGQCAGTYDWLSAFFTSKDDFKSFKYVRYQFTYHATEGGKGTWSDRLVGGKYRSSGDIRALKKK